MYECRGILEESSGRNVSKNAKVWFQQAYFMYFEYTYDSPGIVNTREYIDELNNNSFLFKIKDQVELPIWKPYKRPVPINVKRFKTNIARRLMKTIMITEPKTQIHDELKRFYGDISLWPTNEVEQPVEQPVEK